MTRKQIGDIVVIAIFAIFFVIVALFMILTPKMSKAERQQVIDTFSGFDNYDGIAMRYLDMVFLREKTVDVSSMEYEGKQCYLIDCLEDRCYAYAYASSGKSVNLLEIDYATSEIKYIDTIVDVPRIGSTFYLQNKLFLSTYKDYYYVYDLDSGTYSSMSKAEVEALRAEANGNKHYAFYVNKQKGAGGAVEITQQDTQETKTVALERLNSFAEGEYILSLNSYFTRHFFRKAIEKDGNIYILGMISMTSKFFTNWQCVVLKYDFAADSLSYFSSMYYNWDEDPNTMYIF